MPLPLKPSAVQITQLMLTDRYWRALIHLFTQHSLLKKYLTTQYFDIEEGTVDSAGLKRLSRPWSQSEKFMLNLALHLFNGRLAKINLSDMDYLDDFNKRLVIEALQLRFG